MTTETLTLAGFLLARIAEREAVADRFGDHDHWLMIHNEPVWSSARERAECEAKRRIVETHADGGRNHWDGSGSFVNWCTGCRRPHWPCLTLRILASVYADHPDYDESWRP